MNETCAVNDHEDGATAVEYGIMVSLIALVIFAAVALLGTNLGETYDCVASAVGVLPDADPCVQ